MSGLGSGVLSGGWEFVIAAYVVSGLVLGGYGLSVHWRYRAESRRARQAAELQEPGW